MRWSRPPCSRCCTANGWTAGCVAGVIAQRTKSEAVEDEADIAATEERAVGVVVETTRRPLRA